MFNSDDFTNAWEVWKKHRIEKTQFAYTPTAEQKALSALFKRSDGREDVAIQAIEHSIERNWNAIYLPDNFYNGAKSTNNGHSTRDDKKGGTSSDRMEAARKW